MKAVAVGVGLALASMVRLARADDKPPLGSAGTVYLGAVVPVVSGTDNKGFGASVDASLPIASPRFAIGAHLEAAAMASGSATRGDSQVSAPTFGSELGAYVTGHVVPWSTPKARVVVGLGAGIHAVSTRNDPSFGTEGDGPAFGLRPEIAFEIVPLRISVGYTLHLGDDIVVPNGGPREDLHYSANTLTIGIAFLAAGWPD